MMFLCVIKLQNHFRTQFTFDKWFSLNASCSFLTTSWNFLLRHVWWLNNSQSCLLPPFLFFQFFMFFKRLLFLWIFPQVCCHAKLPLPYALKEFTGRKRFNILRPLFFHFFLIFFEEWSMVPLVRGRCLFKTSFYTLHNPKK